MKTPDKMKTTKKDFKDFEKWCRFYINKFGLNDYSIFFNHTDTGDAIARVSIAILSRTATFQLNTSVYRDDMVGKSWRYFARHEVCHLLIADVSNLVGSYCSEDESKRADEALTCRLTNLLDDTA